MGTPPPHPPQVVSYPAKVEPIDPLRGVPVKTTVRKSFNDQHELSVKPDFARIPSGAGAAQNKVSMNKFYVPTPAKNKGNKKPFEWTAEKIVAIACSGVVLIAAIVIGIT